MRYCIALNVERLRHLGQERGHTAIFLTLTTADRGVAPAELTRRWNNLIRREWWQSLFDPEHVRVIELQRDGTAHLHAVVIARGAEAGHWYPARCRHGVWRKSGYSPRKGSIVERVRYALVGNLAESGFGRNEASPLKPGPKGAYYLAKYLGKSWNGKRPENGQTDGRGGGGAAGAASASMSIAAPAGAPSAKTGRVVFYGGGQWRCARVTFTWLRGFGAEASRIVSEVIEYMAARNPIWTRQYLRDAYGRRWWWDIVKEWVGHPRLPRLPWDTTLKERNPFLEAPA